MTNVETNELSERELDILKLVATGASNKEIAQKLFISSNTVKVHLRNIFTKIGVTSRTEAAMFAVRTGLVIGSAPPELIEEPVGAGLSSDGSISQSGSETITGEAARPAIQKFPRWAIYIIIVGILGLFYLGFRLNPSLSIIPPATTPTSVPQDTPTPMPHWRTEASLSYARSSSALAVYENQIYVIGGMSSQGAMGVTERFNPQENAWVTLSPKPTPVFDARAAVIDGLIYVPGGRTNVNDLQPTDTMEIYDTSSGEWHNGPPLPVALSGFGLIAFEGHLYVFGGWDGTKDRSTVYSFDPIQDEWQERSPMGSPRSFCGLAEVGGKIYVIGGINENQPVTANEIYSPSRDKKGENPWSAGYPLPESRQGIEATTIADTIYIFGGDAAHSNRVGLIYFPQNDTWQSLEASPIDLGTDFAMASIGTDLYFVGGKNSAGFSDQITSYQAIITLSIPIIIK